MSKKTKKATNKNLTEKILLVAAIAKLIKTILEIVKDYKMSVKGKISR